MEIPPKLTAVIELSRTCVKLKTTTDQWAKINQLVQDVPEYSEFKSITNSALLIVPEREDRKEFEINWTSSSLAELMAFSQHLDRKDPDYAKQKENAQLASFAIQTLIAKGYGDVEESTSKLTHFYGYVAGSQHLPQWLEKFGTKHLSNLLYAGEPSLENIQYLLDIDSATPLPADSIKALTYRIRSQMENARRNKDTENTNLEPTVIRGLKHLKERNTIGVNRENFDLIVASFYSPTWTKIVLGDEINLKNIGVGNKEGRSPEALSDQFLHNALSNQNAWGNEVDYFKVLANQCPIDKANDTMASIKNAAIFEALLEHHPDIVGQKLDFSTLTMGLFDRRTVNEEEFKIAKLIASHDIEISVYHVTRLAEQGLDLDDIKALIPKIVAREGHELKAEKLAWADRPDLIAELDMPNSNWHKTGKELQESTYDIQEADIICTSPKWSRILEGPHGKEIKAGIAIKAVLQHVDTPNLGLQWIKSHAKLLGALDMNKAVIETNFLKEASKKSMHGFLQIATALKLDKATINSTIPSDGWGSQTEEICPTIIATGKIGHIQTFLKLGGEITTNGITAAVTKDPILDYVLANSSVSTDEATLTAYLKASENKVKPNYFKLLKRADITNLQAILKPLLEYSQPPQVLEEATEILIEKIGVQELFNYTTSSIAPEKLTNSGFPILEYCVSAGANPDQLFLIGQKYDKPLQTVTLEQHLGTKGQLLLDTYYAKQHAIKTLDSKPQESNEIDIF